MKYILMCTAALAVCLICGWIPARLLGKAKQWSKGLTAGVAAGFSLLLICAVMFGYLGIYYHAEPAIADAPTVEVVKIDGGYLFDGPGEDTALIFYPGAKVEALAYAPLINRLAEQGVDCFLADLPFRMAMFGSNTADIFLNAYRYDHWAAAGHSLGGLVVSGYAAEHPEQIECLILLAAYPGGQIPDSIRLCSIYGTRDGCLNRKVYEESKTYWPASASEFVIEGGSHAQYANYGPQSGDMEPGISREEQQRLTVEYILKMLRAQ